MANRKRGESKVIAKEEKTEGIRTVTADQMITESRCATPRQYHEQIVIISNAQRKTPCEVQNELIGYALGRAKIRSMCSTEEGRLQDPQACKCSDV